MWANTEIPASKSSDEKYPVLFHANPIIIVSYFSQLLYPREEKKTDLRKQLQMKNVCFFI